MKDPLVASYYFQLAVLSLLLAGVFFGIAFIAEVYGKKRIRNMNGIPIVVFLFISCCCADAWRNLTPMPGSYNQMKADRPTQISELDPGYYEIENVWLIDGRKFALIMPVKLGHSDVSARILDVITDNNAKWKLCDVTATELYAPDYRSGTNPFTGIALVTGLTNNASTVVSNSMSVYFPFPDN